MIRSFPISTFRLSTPGSPGWLELLKDRDGRGCDHSQQFVYPGTDGRWRTVGDLAVHIL